MMGISIKQIAALAGVSRGTVDRALNDREGINPQVKAHILRIAADAGYRTNRAGKMLGLRRNPLKIGIQLPSIGNDFYLDVISGMEQAGREMADFGLQLVVRQMKGYAAASQVDQIGEMLQEGIQALAFAPVDDPAVNGLLAELATAHFPVMTLNTDLAEAPRLGYVGNDYDHSGVIAAGLFGLIAADRPFKILALTGSSHIQGHQQRIAGFSRIIQRDYPAIRILDVQENQDDEELSGRIVQDALARWPDMDGLFLAAGGVSGACRALQDRRGGHTVKVVCFDQTPGTLPYRRSGLITASIGQEPFQQGYLPVKYLFEFLLDGTRPPPCTWTRNEIVIREHLLSNQADHAQAAKSYVVPSASRVFGVAAPDWHQ